MFSGKVQNGINAVNKIPSILCLATVVLLLPCTFSALQITFKAFVEVSIRFVRLGDVAEFDAETTTAISLASWCISPAPAAGLSLELDTNKIKTNLLQNIPSLQDIHWKGSATILLTRKGRPIGPGDIESSIATYIET
ncbi:MAG: hypothetical protein U9R57_01650 [Thermodesulfobacteriota bacterium]|nr:hypothetical protein [Thermodesulfobacteriota bacterium]